MKHYIKHQLSPELAKKATQRAAERYTEKFAEYNARAEWTTETHLDISFRVKGVNVKAQLDLEPERIAIDMDIPFILRPFKKKALSVVEDVVQKWIGKAERGELDA